MSQVMGIASGGGVEVPLPSMLLWDEASNVGACRSELEELRAHKDQSESAITHMQALILHLQSQLGRGQPAGRPALEMGRLRDDIKRLESDNRKLEESMSGQIQVFPAAKLELQTVLPRGKLCVGPSCNSPSSLVG